MAPISYFCMTRAEGSGASQYWGQLIKKRVQIPYEVCQQVCLCWKGLKNVFAFFTAMHMVNSWCCYSLSSLEPPNSLDLNGTHPQRIKLLAPNISLSLDQSEGSVLSDDNLDSPDEIDINVDELDTPDEADSFEYTGHGKLPSWQDQSYVKSERLSK